MAKLIKTKIIATVGPACGNVATLARVVKVGVDAFRINFSHGSQAERQLMLNSISQVSAKLHVPLAIMADLCGPKVRVGEMVGGSALLTEGSRVVIQRKPVKGDAKRFSTTLAELIDNTKRGQRILLDDGKLVLQVVEPQPPHRVVCRVKVGGVLSSGKGVNLPRTNLKLSALTEKDRADAAWIARRDFDYVALSFVQRAADVHQLRKILTAGGSKAKIIAKIEKPKALQNIEAIINAADAVLVARGDLGVEMPMPDVPLTQKRLTALCERAGKCCIVATQMLETMTTNATPTRAEVSDVANAVLDGADAVMLSGETAVGKHPVKAVDMMNKIAQRVEKHLSSVDDDRRVGRRVTDATRVRGVTGPTAAIARAVNTLVAWEDIRVVVAYTLTGRTAALLSKMRLSTPILALTPSKRVMRQACLLYGVLGAQADMVEHTRDVLNLAAKAVRRLRWARKGQKILVVSGRPLGKAGTTNTLVVHTM